MNLNFKPQFVDKILSGQKIHTLRYGERWKVGDRIHFYTGLRTKEARLFATGTVVNVLGGVEFKGSAGLSISYAAIQGYLDIIGKNTCELPSVGGHRVWHELAKNDGFSRFSEMLDFFIKNGKEGPYQIIFWKILKTS